MNTYSQASEEIKNRKEFPTDVLKYAGGTALASGGYFLASKALQKIGAFIHPKIPDALAIKGLESISPQMREFLNFSEKEGYSFPEVREYFKEKIQKEENPQEQPKESRNIIQQYSPKLFQELETRIKKGMTPIEAGAALGFESNFTPIIKKMEKDHKTSWSSILQTVFGQSQMAQQPQQGQQQIQPQQMQQQQARPQQAQQMQGGQGQQALLSTLQKIQQSRGQ